METPTGRSTRPTRHGTPRLSDRKKQLFRSVSSKLDKMDENCDIEDSLLGIAPLVSKRKSQSTYEAKKPTKHLTLFGNGDVIDVRRSRLSTSTNSSPETNKENKSLQQTRGSNVLRGTDEQLPQLFTKTMLINSNNSTSQSQSSSPRTPRARNSTSLYDECSSDTDDCGTERERKATKKAQKTVPTIINESSAESCPMIPQNKIRKLHDDCIPTVAFYSNASKSPSTSRRSDVNSTKYARDLSHHSQRKSKGNSPPFRPRLGINKGVHHNIKKPQRTTASINVDDILGSLRNEKLRQLITTKREERAKVEEVHKILRSAKDPIKMAKPLSVIALGDANNNEKIATQFQPSPTLDFSDLSDEEDVLPSKNQSVAMDMEPIIPIIRYEPADTSPTNDVPTKRKFFKSRQRSSTCMEVRITNNIRATVSQGKISLVETPNKPRQIRVKSATFSAEQATVDAILRNLDDTVVDEIIEPEPVSIQQEATHVMEVEELSDPYEKYRRQLPYQTNDPIIIEQQTILLEFLISNNICTDKNFEIFITDPDNHKEEAARIVDNLYTIVYADQLNPVVPESENAISHALGTNNMSEAERQYKETESDKTVKVVEPKVKLFPIFTQHLKPIPQMSKRHKMSHTKRLIAGATGSNQYQIDAGQKAFGARQCQQCGLVYTVHEPEEEQLHREYHDSVHVLRFKGWIDEDIVAVYPNWASDGRIIRVNEYAPSVRLQRLAELIRVVDKELGYSSYMVPKTFVAFFAVRKQQIVGLCLVEPLSRAHRFIQVDGIDYFSEETFEASCGVSRIWVAPLHRRKGIASKLLCAVQSHTVLGTEFHRDRIAFSTPTEDGCALARHFTKNDNFLTYGQ